MTKKDIKFYDKLWKSYQDAVKAGATFPEVVLPNEKKESMTPTTDISQYIGKEYNHPVYGDVIIKAIKPKGADYSKSKIDWILIYSESTKKRTWVGLNSFLKKAVEVTNNEEESITRKYKLGDMYSSDFDAEGMCEMGMKTTIEWGVAKLIKLHNSFEDNNYHTASKPLWDAIQYLKANDTQNAKEKLLEFHFACQAELNYMKSDDIGLESSNNNIDSKGLEIGGKYQHSGGVAEITNIYEGEDHKIMVDYSFSNGGIQGVKETQSLQGFLIEKEKAENLIDEPTVEPEPTQKSIEEVITHKQELTDAINSNVEILKKFPGNKQALNNIQGFLNVYFNEVVSEYPEFLPDFLLIQKDLPAKVKVLASHCVDKDYSKEFRNNLKTNVWDLIPQEFKEYKLPKQLNYLPNHEDSNLVKLLKPFVGDESTRLQLMGVHFDKDGIIATDAHKFLFLAHPEQRDVSTYCITNDCLQSNNSNIAITGSDKYPNYQSVVPNNTQSVSIHAESLYAYLQALKHAKYYESRRKEAFISFGVGENGEHHDMGFNYDYLLTCVDAMLKLGYEQIDISFSTPNRAIIMCPKGQLKNVTKFTTDFALLMPVMIDGIANGVMFFNAESECVQTRGIEDKSCLNPIIVRENRINEKLKKIEDFEAIQSEKAALKERKKAEIKAHLDEIAENERLEKERLEAIEKENLEKSSNSAKLVAELSEIISVTKMALKRAKTLKTKKECKQTLATHQSMLKRLKNKV